MVELTGEGSTLPRLSRGTIPVSALFDSDLFSDSRGTTFKGKKSKSGGGWQTNCISTDVRH